MGCFRRGTGWRALPDDRRTGAWTSHPSGQAGNAIGWSVALPEMLARFMEDAQAMSRAVRWGDAAYIEDMAERGRKIRRSPIESKQA